MLHVDSSQLNRNNCISQIHLCKCYSCEPCHDVYECEHQRLRMHLWQYDCYRVGCSNIWTIFWFIASHAFLTLTQTHTNTTTSLRWSSLSFHVIATAGMHCFCSFPCAAQFIHAHLYQYEWKRKQQLMVFGVANIYIPLLLRINLLAALVIIIGRQFDRWRAFADISVVVVILKWAATP